MKIHKHVRIIFYKSTAPATLRPISLLAMCAFFCCFHSTAFAMGSDQGKALLELARKELLPQLSDIPVDGSSYKGFTNAEKLLIHHTGNGYWIKIHDGELLSPEELLKCDSSGKDKWGARYRIRSKCIEWLCREPISSTFLTNRGIRIKNAIIEGKLQLFKCSLKGPLELTHCLIKSDIDMEGITCSGINLSNSYTASIIAEDSIVKNYFRAEQSITKGELDLFYSKIGKALNLNGYKITSNNRITINAESSSIGGSIFMRNGFKSEGSIILKYSTIGINLELHDALFLNNNNKYDTIDAESITVSQNIFINNSTCEGRLNLTSANIGKTIECSNATFKNPEKETIDLHDSYIGRDLLMDGSFSSEGVIDLCKATIGKNIVCGGGTFRNNTQESIFAEAVKVGNSVFMRNGFKSEGSINFKHAYIGENLELVNSELINVEYYTIEAESIKVNKHIFLNNAISKGKIDLRGANIGKNVEFCNSTFKNNSMISIDLQDSYIGNDILMNGSFYSEGSIDIQRATIGKNFDCSDGAFFNSYATVIDASNSKIHGNIFFNNNFSAFGTINLSNAEIKKNLNCDNGHFYNKNKTTILADALIVAGSIFFRNGCYSNGEINLYAAEIRNNLECSGSRFENEKNISIGAENVKIGGNLYLSKNETTNTPFISKGLVDLFNGTISGTMVCDGGQFFNYYDTVLNALSLKIGNSIFMRDAFKSEGTVNLYGANIGRNLECIDAEFSNAIGTAINAENMDILGSLRIRGTTQINGQLDILGSHIGNQVDMDNVTIRSKNNLTLIAHDIEVKNSFFINNCNFYGGISMYAAHIGADLICYNSNFYKNNNASNNIFNLPYSLYASGLDIDGDLIITLATLNNQVDLESSYIKRNMTISDCIIQSNTKERPSLYAQDLHVGGTLSLEKNQLVTGKIQINHAELGHFSIKQFFQPRIKNCQLDLRSSHAKCFELISTLFSGELLLDGFHYDSLKIPILETEQSTNNDTKNKMFSKSQELANYYSNWLGTVPDASYTPQPYEELSNALREQGYEEAAIDVQIQKNKLRLKHSNLTPLEETWSNLTGFFIDYGYRPLKSLWFVAGFIALGTLLASCFYRYGLFARTTPGDFIYDGDPTTIVYRKNAEHKLRTVYPPFNPLIYSLDSFIPLIDLHQCSFWQPSLRFFSLFAKQNNRSLTSFVTNDDWFSINLLWLDGPDKWIQKKVSNRHWFHLIRAYFYVHIFMGWLLTSLFIAGLAGIIKS